MDKVIVLAALFSALFSLITAFCCSLLLDDYFSRIKKALRTVGIICAIVSFCFMMLLLNLYIAAAP